MALNHRIGRLELRARASSPARCPGCGHAPGDGFELKIAGPGAVERIGDAPPATELPGDRCSRCRHRFVFRVPPPERARTHG